MKFSFESGKLLKVMFDGEDYPQQKLIDLGDPDREERVRMTRLVYPTGHSIELFGQGVYLRPIRRVRDRGRGDSGPFSHTEYQVTSPLDPELLFYANKRTFHGGGESCGSVKILFKERWEDMYRSFCNLMELSEIFGKELSGPIIHLRSNENIVECDR